MMGETYGQPHRVAELDNYAIKLTFHSTEERDSYMQRFDPPRNNTTSNAPHPNNPAQRTDMPLEMSLALFDDSATFTVTGYVTYRSEGWVTRWNAHQSNGPILYRLQHGSKLDQACFWITQVTDMEYENAATLLGVIQRALLDAHPAWVASSAWND